MKNSISHILSFVMMIVMVMTIFYVSLQQELKVSSIVNELKQSNYYHKIYSNILLELDDYIVNSELMDLYKNYLTIDKISTDVNHIINSIYSNSDNKLSRYDDFYNIAYNYSKDEIISDKYADGVNKIYINNLFPEKAFTLFNNIYMSNTDTLLLVMISIVICLIIVVINFLIHNSLYHFKISILASSIVVMLPIIFINIFNIFEDFIYTNQYYTDLIISVLTKSCLVSFFIGICFVLFLIIGKFVKEFFNYFKYSSK